MTPPKLLTVEEIQESIEELDTQNPLHVVEVRIGRLASLLATARAAMKVVEAEKLKDSCGGLSDFISIKSRIDIAMKPFQQTGEDKGGRGDE